MFKIKCMNCNNEITLKVEKDEEIDMERESYYVRSASLPISMWQEHDVVGFSCDKCKASVYTFV